MTTDSINLESIDIAQALARELFRKVPNANNVISVAAVGFEALLHGVLNQPDAPARSLEALFASLLPYSEQRAPSTALLDSTDPINSQAAGIAAILSPLLGASLTAATPSSLPLGIAHAAQSPNTLKSDFDELAKNEPFKTIHKALQDSGVMDWAKVSLGSAPLAAAFYTPEKVSSVLRALAKLLAKLGPTLQPIITYVEYELAQSLKRTVFAEAITIASEALPFSIKSNFTIGNHVHKSLQESYVARYSKSRDIVVERWNPIINRSELVVIGTTTAFKPIALQTIAANRRLDPMMFFLSLRTAMNGFKMHKDSWLRADLVDAGIDQIWEIKPTSSLVSGVWQETLYRVTHNIVRMVIMSVLPAATVVPRFLTGGGFWGIAETSLFGSGNSRFIILDNIVVSKQAGKPAVAFPFQVGVLPGLLGYFVLSGPNISQLHHVIDTVIIAALLAALKKMMNELKKLGDQFDEAVQAAKHILEELNEVAKKFNEIIINLLVLNAILSAAIALGIVLTLAAPEAVAIGAIVLVVVAVSDLASKHKSANSEPDKSVEITDVKIGPVQINGMPTVMVPQLLAEVQKQLHSIAGAAVNELQQAPLAQS